MGQVVLTESDRSASGAVVLLVNDPKVYWEGLVRESSTQDHKVSVKDLPRRRRALSVELSVTVELHHAVQSSIQKREIT
jgi:hypothetical protein